MAVRTQEAVIVGIALRSQSSKSKEAPHIVESHIRDLKSANAQKSLA
jgi:hypothetical protein